MNEQTFNVDVVSPQFPCGAAWLANALLELNVPLWELWSFDTRAEWLALGDGAHEYQAAHEPWKQTLASLAPGRRFAFRDGVRPRFSHAFPWQIAPAPRTVVMVRDPRDALHSEWRRHLKNQGLPADTGLREFMGQPFLGGPVSHADMLWLHLKCWLHVLSERPAQVLALRFEDCKRDPVGTLETAAAWLGVQATPAELRRAVQASDVQHLLAVENRLARQDPSTRQFNRAGIAYEWQVRWPDAWHRAIGPHWDEVLARLDYPPAPAQATGLDEAATGLARRAQAPDAGAFLAWRGLDAGPLFDEWAARIGAWLEASHNTSPGAAR